MELRHGYKSTDLGPLPDEWETRTLGSLTTLMTNGFVGTATSAYVETDDGVLYIQGYNVEPNGFNLNGIKRVSKAFHLRNQKSCLRAGDLLTIQTGDIGVTAIVPMSLAGANCHALVISRLDRRSADPGYYSQYFNSELGHDAFKEIETGSTMKHLNVGDLVRLLVPVPPLPEQKAIAAALSDVDALLSALDRLIAKKRDLKQAAMQQLLTGQTRLPGFSGRRDRRPTELGPLPEDWLVLPVGDIASVKTGPFGSTLHEEDYVAEGTPIITVEHLGDRGIRHVGLPMVSETDRRRLSTYSLQTGDIVFSRVGSVDRNALVSHEEAGWLFSGRLLRVRPSDRRVNTRYLSHHFHSEPFKQRVRSVAVGQTMASLNTQILKGVLVAVPPVLEQEAIGAVLSDIDIELTALEQRRDKTRLLKQGMMQELLTGRTRLI